MSGPTLDQLQSILSQVPYPGFSKDIVSLQVVRAVTIDQGQARIELELPAGQPELFSGLERAIRQALGSLPGLERIEIVRAAPARTALPAAGARPAASSSPARPIAARIFGVASGKGGVGKSTVAVNVAVALAARGRRVGFLDADVHGPSAPLMFGLQGRKPERADEGGRPLPLEAFGVKVMSMGFFVERDNAVVWRGPIVGNFIKQLITDVAWGPLDDLVIDFPPGTGDAQLTISQTLQLSGVVVVTTPNELALIDAVKAIAMFSKVQVPIAGIVENMSHYTCAACHAASEPFGHGGAQREAERLGLPLLGQLPLDPRVVRASDAGQPIVASEPDSALAQAYRAIAERLDRIEPISDSAAAQASAPHGRPMR